MELPIRKSISSGLAFAANTRELAASMQHALHNTYQVLLDIDSVITMLSVQCERVVNLVSHYAARVGLDRLRFQIPEDCGQTLGHITEDFVSGDNIDLINSTAAVVSGMGMLPMSEIKRVALAKQSGTPDNFIVTGGTYNTLPGSIWSNVFTSSPEEQWATVVRSEHGQSSISFTIRLAVPAKPTILNLLISSASEILTVRGITKDNEDILLIDSDLASLGYWCLSPKKEITALHFRIQNTTGISTTAVDHAYVIHKIALYSGKFVSEGYISSKELDISEDNRVPSAFYTDIEAYTPQGTSISAYYRKEYRDIDPSIPMDLVDWLPIRLKSGRTKGTFATPDKYTIDNSTSVYRVPNGASAPGDNTEEWWTLGSNLSSVSKIEVYGWKNMARYDDERGIWIYGLLVNLIDGATKQTFTLSTGVESVSITDSKTGVRRTFTEAGDIDLIVNKRYTVEVVASCWVDPNDPLSFYFDPFTVLGITLEHANSGHYSVYAVPRPLRRVFSYKRESLLPDISIFTLDDSGIFRVPSPSHVFDCGVKMRMLDIAESERLAALTGPSTFYDSIKCYSFIGRISSASIQLLFKLHTTDSSMSPVIRNFNVLGVV